MSQSLYSVQAFADRAGVTVRTLHHYDRNNLLKPSQRTAAGHRRYSDDDLLRLQQILTLKFMGFSLREIADLLHHPAYSLRESLEIQKDAIDAQINRLQRVSQAMQFILYDMTDAEQDAPPDWEQVMAVIEGVNSDEHQTWLKRYFDDDQMTLLSDRARQLSPEAMAAGQQAWRDLMNDFEAARQTHNNPAHPDSQALAARCAALVASFTQGNNQIRQSLEGMYSNFDNIPAGLRMGDEALYKFIHAAMQHYEKQQKPD